jgi:hypothetical protein
VKSYRDKSVTGEYIDAWHDVRAEQLGDGRWVVEFNDGDPMGGSRNTVLIVGPDRFSERFEPYEPPKELL